MNRLLTRSSAIKSNFPEEYIALTKHTDIVVSTAQQFSWAGGYAQLLGGAGLMQKLPFRALAGISRNTNGSITYNTARAYLPSQQKVSNYTLSHFVDTQSPELFQNHIVPLLTNWPPGTGIDIHTFLEYDWVDTVPFFVSIAAGILLLSGSLTPDFFILAGKYSAAELKNSSEMGRGLELLWRIVCMLENNFLHMPSIAEVAVCLTSARLPVVVQTNDVTNALQSDGRLCYTQKGASEHQTSQWFMHKYDELYPRQQALSFEWGTIASGSHHMQPVHFPQEKATPNFGDLHAMERHFHQDLDTFPDSDDLLRQKLEIIHKYTMHTIDAFGASLHSYDGNNFLQSLHSMHQVSNLLQFQKLDHVISPGAAPFKAFVKKHLRACYKYLITEKGMRGGAKVFFAAPRHVLSGHMESLRSLYPHEGPGVYEYLSWMDGFGNGGVEVEYMAPLPVQSMDLREQIEKEMPSPDIFLDCSRKKIIMNNHRVTSNDLRSQNFTVDLLHALVEAEGLTLPLEDLPKLSYLDTPNELQHKVLTPFVRTVEKYTGKRINWFTELRGGSWWVSLDLQGVSLVFSHGASARMLCRKSGAVQERLLAS